MRFQGFGGGAGDFRAAARKKEFLVSETMFQPLIKFWRRKKKVPDHPARLIFFFKKKNYYTIGCD